MTDPIAYGNLCTLFYDATKGYAPERELNFYASFIERYPGRVLEAMSGSGRLQIPLVLRGYTVDGVDTSDTMLASCRARCAELCLKPELYNQPLQELALPHRYATVTIAVGSFQLIYDRIQALEALKKIHAHMHPTGSNLLIDIFTPDFANGEKHSTRIARLDNQRVIRLQTREIFDEHARIADAFCNYELIVNGVLEQHEHELIQVTWYTDQELKELFNASGFTIVAIHDEQFRASGPSRIVQAQPQ
jgi:cyclopropane fatty-acyl-phospholipid synthase-like methyltransferase